MHRNSCLLLSAVLALAVGLERPAPAGGKTEGFVPLFNGTDFSGWKVPPGKSEIVEVYPALWSHSFPRDGRDSHQQDAYAAAEWLRRNDLDSSLEGFFNPSLTAQEREVAAIEGWILGIA